MSTAVNHQNSSYDRLKELKQFDDSKIGVKGLVDSGINSIPRFFHHPPDTLLKPIPDSRPQFSVPIIDLSGPRSTVIDQIRRASSTLGFFQITNHCIPESKIDSLISSVKSFNEQPTDVKSQYYHREMGHGASYSTNFDLYRSKAASWRDTVQIMLAPTPPDWSYVPEVCRAAVREWEREVVKIGDELMGLLGEGLGLRREKLKEMSCLEGRLMVAHYYPYCPQPDLTVGITSHTDPVVLTVLMQNDIGGLQVKLGEGDWVDVEPVPGAFVVNIGDILQIISNDEYKSAEHQVLANPFHEPRISVAVFFNPGNRENLYGPLSEIISAEKPPVYQQFQFADFIKRFLTKELDGKTLTNCYKL